MQPNQLLCQQIELVSVSVLPYCTVCDVLVREAESLINILFSALNDKIFKKKINPGVRYSRCRRYV